jgi:hypothetical protein
MLVTVELLQEQGGFSVDGRAALDIKMRPVLVSATVTGRDNSAADRADISNAAR